MSGMMCGGSHHQPRIDVAETILAASAAAAAAAPPPADPGAATTTAGAAAAAVAYFLLRARRLRLSAFESPKMPELPPPPPPPTAAAAGPPALLLLSGCQFIPAARRLASISSCFCFCSAACCCSCAEGKVGIIASACGRGASLKYGWCSACEHEIRFTCTHEHEHAPLFFECFPYVRPEPVLVKRSCLVLDGAKRCIFLPDRSRGSRRAARAPPA
jgi:hypothetical protein